MSKAQHNVTGGTTANCSNNGANQRIRPKAAYISPSSGDRQLVQLEGGTDDTPTTGKRYPLQRRGSRKKTLSLNPEEREALENLIEEVIMGGVGEGVIDSDVSSSDEDDDAVDEHSPSSTENSLPSSAAAAVGDAARQDTFVRGGKKFYPGQLKVALKHMHDLPPRFVRKLAKAQQYLDAGGSTYSKPVVSVGRIEEEEENTGHLKDDSKQPKLTAVTETAVTYVSERERDKTRLKENKLKDAKKMIRTLLTDRDQYVDETVNGAVVSSQSHTVSGDGFCSSTKSTSSDHKSQESIATYHQQDMAATRHAVSGSGAVSVSENKVSAYAGSFSSVATCTSETHLYQTSIVSNTVAEHAPRTSDINNRNSQLSNISVSSSHPIQAQPFHSPSYGIPQYQLSVPVVHGMKPAPVLSQSPPGTQYWIPEAVVPSNAPGYYGSSPPGYYGSSPPVVGMTWVPGAFNQPAPYAHSLQSSYPAVQGVHASYTPQYLYSTSPPSQGLLAQPYPAASYSQPVSYPLAVLQREPYARPPNAMSANFYQNTPPPGYSPAQSHPATDPRRIFASSMPSPGARNQMAPADHVHKLSALSATACHQSPTQPVSSSIDTRSGNAKPASTASRSTGVDWSSGTCATRNHETYEKSHPTIHPSTYHSGGYQASDASAKTMPSIRHQMHRSATSLVNALSSQHSRFSISPVNVPLSNPCSVSASSNLVPNTSVAAPASQSAGVDRSAVIEAVASLDSALVDKAIPPTFEHSTIVSRCSDVEMLKPQRSNLSNSLLSRLVSKDCSFSGKSEAQTVMASCNVVSEPCSTTPTPLMMQESVTRNAVAEHSDVPFSLSCNPTEVLTQQVNDISGASTVSLSSESSGSSYVASSDASSVIQVMCSSHSCDHLGVSTNSVEVTDTESGVYQSELQPELNSICEPETVDKSSYDKSQFMHPAANSASCSELPATVADEVADISLDCGAMGVASSGLSSELSVTLSSDLISALVDMFGLPAELDVDHGMLVICQFINKCKIANYVTEHKMVLSQLLSFMYLNLTL